MGQVIKTFLLNLWRGFCALVIAGVILGLAAGLLIGAFWLLGALGSLLIGLIGFKALLISLATILGIFMVHFVGKEIGPVVFK